MKSVVIGVRKGNRDRLHSIKNPGQTLDGIITQSICGNCRTSGRRNQESIEIEKTCRYTPFCSRKWISGSLAAFVLNRLCR